MNNQNTIKPEMNSENKAKLFAQYYNQTVLFNPDIDHLMVLNSTTLGDHHEGDCLLLTPLSDITDKDAIEVAHNVGMINAFVSERDSEVVMVVDDSYYIGIYSIGVIVMYKGLGLNIKPYWSDTQKLYDKIRSKGYALPWLNYSVEDMVQAGWIKLKGGTHE